MQSLHTEVEGLIDDPDCTGDIIADTLLQAYFDSLFDTTAEGPGKAIAALIAFARQTACLGTRQSALLASNLYDSYNTVATFLRVNGVYGVGTYMSQAALQPMLLVYDVEKYRGEASPLTRWFRENRNALMDGMRANKHPPRWHGLWLYDRRSGHMVGYRPTPQPRDENDVDLGAFYGSLGSLPNLTDNTCTFGEMIERGPTALGYLCAGSVCQQSARQPGNGTAGAPGGGSRAGAGRFAALAQEFGNTVCQEPGAGGGADRAAGLGGSLCAQGGGLNVGGAKKAANMVKCLSQQVVRPGTEGFRCLAEATGLCSNPVDRATKDLQQATFAGVKLGRDCGIGKGSGKPGPVGGSKDDDIDLPPLPRLDDKLNMAKADFRFADADFMVKQDDAFRKADDLQLARDNLKAARGPDIKPAEKAVEAAQTAYAAANKALVTASEERRKAERKVKEEETKLAEEEKKRKAEQEKKDKQAKKPGSKGMPACPPGTPDCGDNSCTAMSDQMGQTLACSARAIAGSERDPVATRPGGCDPAVCDPVEPTGRGPATGACLASLTNDTTITRTRQCWAVECSRGRTATTNNCCGADGGTNVGGLPGADAGPATMCSQIRCSEGSFPTPGAHGCECRESTTAPGGGQPGTPRASYAFAMRAPPALLDVNTRPRGNTGLPPGP